ncbi:MAG: methyltransferase domain-containing protein [Pseudomonadota bacterium]
MPAMEFTGDIAALQQGMARTRDLAQRRLAILHEIAPARGGRIIEIGCGAGLLLREIALATGPHGLAAGIDVSPDQVAAAEAETAGVPGVRVEVADAAALPFPDAVFDAGIAAHVLEYLDDPPAALRAMRRVLKPGARLVVLATNWDADFWHGTAPETAAPVLAAWRAEMHWPNLPARLGPMMIEAGFTGLRQVPVPVVNTSLGEDQMAPWMARIMAAHAGGEAGTPWLREMAASDGSGEIFYSSVPILTTATAA